MDYLDNTDYFVNYNEYCLHTITNVIVPYISQFEFYSSQNHYSRIIQVLLEADYSYEEIYYSLGVYLLSQSDEIEEDMNVIRTILYGLQRSEMNVVNQVMNLMNLILPVGDQNFVDIPLTVSKEVLDKLPEVCFSELKTDEKSCSICMDDFEPQSILRKISCSHLFHKNCLDKWLTENSYKCPICRSSVAEHHANI